MVVGSWNYFEFHTNSNGIILRLLWYYQWGPGRISSLHFYEAILEEQLESLLQGKRYDGWTQYYFVWWFGSPHEALYNDMG